MSDFVEETVEILFLGTIYDKTPFFRSFSTLKSCKMWKSAFTESKVKTYIIHAVVKILFYFPCFFNFTLHRFNRRVECPFLSIFFPHFLTPLHNFFP